MTLGAKILVGCSAALLILILLWINGRLDPVLYHVGLNRYDCITISGDTHCGKDVNRLRGLRAP